MANSIKKGKRYERRIVNKLEKRFGIEFHRVPMSGAYSTSEGINDSELVGDVFTKDEDWNKRWDTIIECKKRKDAIDLVHYAKFVMGGNVELKEWTEQCIRECYQIDKSHFWLIFSWDYGKDLIIVGEHNDKDKNGIWDIKEPILLDTYLYRIIGDR